METKLNSNFAYTAHINMAVASIINSDNELIEIFAYADSGKVITRGKLDTLIGVLHPGIIIGKDKWGGIWVAHNHYKNKRPTFDLLNKYCDSNPPKWDNRLVKFSKEQIVQLAIAEVMKGKAYDATNYNCQTFVNIIVRGEHKSEAIDKITNGAMFGGALLTLFGVITKNKALTMAGVTIAGAGGLAKGYSRIKK